MRLTQTYRLGGDDGGVSVGWDSERDAVHVSLFVGAFHGQF
ncbi:MAG TPA: hypothetical protein VF613_18560 [Longimicrobium sp.]